MIRRWLAQPVLNRLNELEALMSAQETALNEAIAAVAQNVTDVREGITAIIAKLEAVEEVDLSEETQALTDLAASLQEGEDALKAATGGEGDSLAVQAEGHMM